MSAAPTDEELDALLRSGPPVPVPEAHVDEGHVVAWRAGALDAAAATELEAHLADCPECRALARALEQSPNDFDFARAERALAAEARRPTRRWVVGGLALAAGVALAVFVVRAPTPEGPAFPAFAVEGPSGGVKAVRGDAAEGRVFLPQSRVRVDLVPPAPLDPAPAARAYVARADGPLRAVEGLKPGQGGAWRFEARAGDLFDAAGAWTLYLALGPDVVERAGQSPEAARAATPAARWHIIPIEFRTRSQE